MLESEGTKWKGRRVGADNRSLGRGDGYRAHCQGSRLDRVMVHIEYPSVCGLGTSAVQGYHRGDGLSSHAPPGAVTRKCVIGRMNADG